MNLIASNVKVRKSQTAFAPRMPGGPETSPADLDVFPCINLISTFHKQYLRLTDNAPNHRGDGVSISE